MYKAPTAGIINYGPTLPIVGTVADGSLFYLTSGDVGLYIHSTRQDSDLGTLGSQPALAWLPVSTDSGGAFVELTGSTMTGALRIEAGVASSSLTTGSLVVDGGVGISGTLRTSSIGLHADGTGANPAIFWATDDGANLGIYRSADDTLSITTGANALVDFAETFMRVVRTTASTSPTTGALQVAGGTGIAGSLFVGGNTTLTGDLIVNGNLTVNQDTVTLNVGTLVIEDPILRIGQNATDDNLDRGTSFLWRTGASARTGFFGFDDSTGRFTFVPTATITGEVVTGTVGVFDLSGTRLGEHSDVLDYVDLAPFEGSVLRVDSGLWTPVPYNVFTSVANSTGSTQFSAAGESAVRFAVTNGTTSGNAEITFTPATRQVTYAIPSYDLDINPTSGTATTANLRLLNGSGTPATNIALTGASGVNFTRGTNALTIGLDAATIASTVQLATFDVNPEFATSFPPTAFPLGSLRGFDAYRSTDFPIHSVPGAPVENGQWVGLTVVGAPTGASPGRRGMQHAVHWDVNGDRATSITINDEINLGGTISVRTEPSHGPYASSTRVYDDTEALWSNWSRNGIEGSPHTAHAWGWFRVNSFGQNVSSGGVVTAVPASAYNIASIRDLTGTTVPYFRIIWRYPMATVGYAVSGAVEFEGGVSTRCATMIPVNKTTNHMDVVFRDFNGNDLSGVEFNFSVTVFGNFGRLN